MDAIYIISSEEMQTVAVSVRDVAFPGYAIQERDGLNVGGGQYFKICLEADSAVVCVADHGDPPSEQFAYMVYLPRSDVERLARVHKELVIGGIRAEVVIHRS